MGKILKLFLTLLLPAATVPYVQAQDGKPPAGPDEGTLPVFSGRIVDARSEPLEGATIIATCQADTLFLSYAFSDKNGWFTLPNLPRGRKVGIWVSFVGMEDTSSVFTFNQATMRFFSGNWTMQPSAKELQKVTVAAKPALFSVRRDTVSVGTLDFKPRPTDLLDQLLLKLPGMHIDADGNMTINGKKVDRIRVDGRDFFGDDLHAAIENLPAWMIERIQITDSRNMDAERAGIPRRQGGTVTLDLTLKKDVRNGTFGRGELAKGTAGRYGGKGTFNVFDGDLRFSAVASANNISEVMGGNAAIDPVSWFRHPNAERGVLKDAWGGAFSLNTRPLRNLTFDVNGETNVNHFTEDRMTQQDRILPGSTLVVSNHRRVDHLPRTTRAFTGSDLAIDSLQHLNIGADGFFETIERTTRGETDVRTADGARLLRQDNFLKEEGNQSEVNVRGSYRLGFPNSQSFVAVYMTHTFRQGRGHQLNQADGWSYLGNDSMPGRLDQQTATSDRAFSQSLWLDSRREMGKGFATIFRYDYRLTVLNRQRDAFNLNGASGKYDVRDAIYTGAYRAVSWLNKPTLLLGYTHGKLTAETGAGLTFLDRTATQGDKQPLPAVRQRYLNPVLNINYDWNRFLQQSLYYYSYAEHPLAEEITPILDNTNPLAMRKGNASVRPSVSHRFGTELVLTYPSTGVVGRFSGGVTMNRNQVIGDTRYDSLGRQVSEFRNANGVYNMDGHFVLAWTRKREQWQFHASAVVGGNSGLEKIVVNQVPIAARRLESETQLYAVVGWKELIQWTFSGAMRKVRMNYHTPGVPVAAIDLYRITSGLSLHFSPGWECDAMLIYNYNTSMPAGLQPATTILSASLLHHFLPSQRITAFASIGDMLSNNAATTRNIGVGAVESSGVNVLRRYITIGLKYRLSKFELPVGY